MACLPTELLDKIISEIAEAHPVSHIFLPKSSLVPLLRVSKAWHLIAEWYLYQSISIGSPFETDIIESDGYDDTECQETVSYADTLTTHSRKRYGLEVAEDLLRTFQEYSRLAGLVKTLRIEIPGSFAVSETLNAAYSQTGIDIIRLCGNVEHVEMLGCHAEKAAALLDALEDKSLISFTSLHCFVALNFEFDQDSQDSRTLLFSAMGKWPRLRSITFPSLPCHYIASPPFCRPIEVFPDRVCPLLEEFKAGTLHGNELRALRTLCPNIKKFTFAVLGSTDPDGVHALSECLRAWAPSLEVLDGRVHNTLDLRGRQILLESFRTLTGVKQLCILNMKWDISLIADMPNLEQFHCDWDSALFGNIAISLEDMRKFPSLHIIDAFSTYPTEFDQNLEVICHRRHIRLTLFICE